MQWQHMILLSLYVILYTYKSGNPQSNKYLLKINCLQKILIPESNIKEENDLLRNNLKENNDIKYISVVRKENNF